jgi:hypothetical protein
MNVKFTLSESELKQRSNFIELLQECPIPQEEWENNVPLFLSRQSFSRSLFLHEIYKKIISIQGVVMEFGVRWGRDLALFHTFRGMYEPYNHYRKIVGFDTFEGFPSVNSLDGDNPIVKVGAYNVTEGYEKYLNRLLDYHQSKSPLSHINKFEIVKGDATQTLPEYLERYPNTIIALAYFDMDIFEPTAKCLKLIEPYLVKGSIIGFDELGSEAFPGEAIAFRDFFGKKKIRLERFPFDSVHCYCIIE